MIIPNQHRHLTGALSAFAVRMAASASLPVEQLRLTPLRRQPGPPKIPPRQNRPAPPPSRQFVRAMSTQVARDRRLSPRAAGLAVLLVAVAGKGSHVDLTRGYLAARLGVSERTVARLLAQLRSLGYIATRQTIGALRRDHRPARRAARPAVALLGNRPAARGTGGGDRAVRPTRIP